MRSVWTIIVVALLASLLVLIVAPLPDRNRRAAAIGAQNRHSTEQGSTVHTLPAILVNEARVVEHEFVVSNPTDRTLRILDLTRSCSCTNATIASRELAPGQETKLTMKVDLRGRSGAFATECALVLEGGDRWRYRLEVPIYRRVEFIPNSLRSGTVDPGVVLQRDFVVLTYARKNPPSDPVLSVVEGPDGVRLDKGQSAIEELQDGIMRRRTPVRMYLTPPNTANAGLCRIVSDVPSAAWAMESSLRLDWVIDNPYQMTPKRVFFGAVREAAGNVTCRVTMERRDGASFRVTQVRCNCPGLTCSCSTIGSSKPQHEVVVTLDRAGLTGFLYGRVVVETDDSIIPRWNIPVSASQ